METSFFRVYRRTDKKKMIVAFFAILRTRLKTEQLMENNRCLFSDPHKKHINTLCGQNAGFLDVKAGGTERNREQAEAERTYSA